MSKIIFLLTLISLYAPSLYSQDLPEVQRIGSTRQDIIKLLGMGQDVTDSKTVYDLADKKVIVFYIGNNCSDNGLDELNKRNQTGITLTKDTVWGFTVIPKIEFSINLLIKGIESKGFISNGIKDFELSKDKIAYLDWGLHSITVSQKTNNNIEIIDTIYHLPFAFDFSGCSSIKDRESGIKLFDALEKRSRMHAAPLIQIAPFFVNDSASQKEVATQEFCQAVNSLSEGDGTVIINLKQGENIKRYPVYEKSLKILLKKSKCNFARVKFVRSRENDKTKETSISFFVASYKAFLF